MGTAAEATHTVGDVARIARVSVRTLHHYEAIGLLTPSARTDAGYRLYGAAELARLQEILVLRALGLPLEAIRATLDDPARDRLAALEAWREALVLRRAELDGALAAVERTITAMKDGRDMAEHDPSALFDGFDPEEHGAEARERWGHTDAFRESARRTKGYGPEDWARMRAELEALESALGAACARGVAPDAADAQALAERHRAHIDRWFYPCSTAMHAGLADMYVGDPRFAARYEARAPGLAAWLRDAIRANAGLTSSST
ncbi:MAG: MerR family transcriptional regulator [Myxococcales bacterium]|nr:MerR family transcriptional regulator [Myxococcales bacterium]MCB9737111.1 MerR family transcriptional regulator [Deltaproteobacteria bacterium]